MTIGGDYEFFSRDEWKSVRSTYGLGFRESVPLNGALMYSAAREGLVDVIVAFSTDGRIAAYDLTVLDDPAGAFPPYDAVLLLSRPASENQQLVDALKPLIGSISIDLMRQANRAVDLDGVLPERAAMTMRGAAVVAEALPPTTP
jgi:osmoprotectant transport system permease protein